MAPLSSLGSLGGRASAVPSDACWRWWGRLSTRMRPCLQAVMLDSTDVNLWYKIGHVALRLIRVPLARHAFEEGLRCNPDHWPCLDNLITVLYTLSDYTSEWGVTEFSREHFRREGGLVELGAGAGEEGLAVCPACGGRRCVCFPSTLC